MAKFDHITFLGKLQYATEFLEEAIEDKEFNGLPENEREKLLALSVEVFMATQKVYSRRRK